MPEKTGNSIVVQVNDDRIWIRSPPIAKVLCAELENRLWHGAPIERWSVPATPQHALNVKQKFTGWEFGCFGDTTFRDLLQAGNTQQAANELRHAPELPAIPFRGYCMNWELPCPTLLPDWHPDHQPRFTAVDQNTPVSCPHCGGPVGSMIHQRQAFHVTQPRGGGILWMGMGTGKSGVTAALADSWNVMLALILAPPNASLVWPDQFEWHSLRQWVVCNHGGINSRTGKPIKNPSAKGRVRAAETAIERAKVWDRPCAIVVPYPLLPHMKSWLYSIRSELDLLVGDEVHQVKKPGGVWRKITGTIAKDVPHVLANTGTLMPNSKLDAYAPAGLVDTAIFGTDFVTFRARYAVVKNEKKWVKGKQGPEQRTIPVIEGFQRTEEFDERLARITYYCDETVLNLPPVMPPVIVTYQLGAEASRLYRQLEDEFVAELGPSFAGDQIDEDDVDGGVIVARNALAKLMRLAQLANGHATVERDCRHCGGHWQAAEGCPGCDGAGIILEYGERVDDAFDRALAEQLAALDPREPVVGFARFVPDLDVLEAACSAKGAEPRVYGELSGRRKDGLTGSGKLAEDRDVVGVQIQAGGEGVNFTRSRYAFYTSVGFDNGAYSQSRKRLDRPGQQRGVTYVSLHAQLDDGSETVNQVEYRALLAKTSAAAACARAIQEAHR